MVSHIFHDITYKSYHFASLLYDTFVKPMTGNCSIMGIDSLPLLLYDEPNNPYSYLGL